ncbi:hypothetical protein ACFL2A_03080, partial [Thermodesulfobacteriota bacterium]
YKDLTPIEQREVTCEELNPLFSDSFDKALFKAKVNIYGNYFTGLLVIKRLETKSTRVAFLTEVGITMFDFEFMPDGETKVHSVMKAFDKKSVIRTIQNDFKLLFMRAVCPADALLYDDSAAGQKVFKIKSVDEYNYYFVENKRLKRIENTSGWFKNVAVSLDEYKNEFPQKIKFLHYNFNMEIRLAGLAAP